MFGPFEEGNGMTTDAWSDRLKTRQDYDHHSIVARTLLSPPSSSSTAPSTSADRKKKTSNASNSNNNVVQDTVEIDYCDSYPNTNTNKTDWALLAAHRVGNVLGIKLNDSKKSVTNDRNLATIFFAKPTGERFKDDQRFKLIEKLTLESILLAIFLPLEMPQHLNSLASQHTHLRLAARQCSVVIEQNHQSLSARGARERDLIIKRILFHADNGKTECSYLIEAKEFSHSAHFSDQTLESVSEPDLFGRAIGVLVHEVLQSPSLRVKAGLLQKQYITLTLSWANALENIKLKEEEEPVQKEDVKKEDDVRKEELRKEDFKKHSIHSQISVSAPPPPPPPAFSAIAKSTKANDSKFEVGKSISHPLAEEEVVTAFF